ncbi:hypothetical protein DAETH_48700 (plasmid) [Deinococcus aetherius]|uniref:Uncharacterized protein n=1 Tax=Deinococcus aetherius TaxID=200252 RepID=A0ABN6RR65_9DEIO|nr:hypothetical protein [Deinococcus aetherius]BDP44901.1 hypothetical protein DAETH_48700 [Deinococcus aetherius]
MTTENDASGSSFEYKGLGVDYLNKRFVWWSVDHIAELKSYARDHLNTQMFSMKLKLYEEAYQNEQDEEKARVYVVMIHQLYFELLEYLILLLMTFTRDVRILPIVMMMTYPKNASAFAEKLKEGDVFDTSGEKISISGNIVGLVQHICYFIPADEKYKELVILPFYRTISYAVSDYLDEYYKNSYNSIKHGNRGVTSSGDLSLGLEDGGRFALFDTDYAFKHLRLTEVSGKSNIITQRVVTFTEKKQIALRSKIVLSMLGCLHDIHKRKILGKYMDSQEPIGLYDLNTVEEAWNGPKNNGHFVMDNAVKFEQKAVEVLRPLLLSTFRL